MSSPKPPPSASNFLINLFGGFCFIAAVKMAHFFYPDMSAFELSLICTPCAIIPIVLCEIIFLKVHQRPSAKLKKPEKANKERISIKLLGYYGTLACVMLLYLLIPEYSKEEFYSISLTYLLLLLLFYIALGWPYMCEVDVRMENPYDAYWHMGNLLAGNWKKVDRTYILNHVKSVLLRAFFLPVMLTYLTTNVQSIIDGHEGFSHSFLAGLPDTSALSIIQFFLLVYFFLAAIDTLFAVIGYLMTFRAMDSHIRSTEPTFLGWFICLICYYPFWETLIITSIFKEFYANPEWYKWFGESDILLGIWGPVVIIGMCLEAFTTLTFGIRFSNLTYRGLITSGTFRLSKHPQYVFKMMNRFCFYIPFLSLHGPLGAIQNMLMFAGLCFIYYLRAKTEENHLSRYPEYVEYANWVNKNGIFRGVGKMLPFLVYSEEKAKAGKLI